MPMLARRATQHHAESRCTEEKLNPLSGVLAKMKLKAIPPVRGVRLIFLPQERLCFCAVGGAGFSKPGRWEPSVR